VTPPPSGTPPVLLTVDYAHDRPLSADPYASVEGGRLHVRAPGPRTFRGVAVAPQTFRDVLLDVELGVVSGAQDDLFGLFLRQSGEQRLVFWALSSTGRCVIGLADGSFTPLVDGPLAAGMAFDASAGGRNRLQVVAIGPSLTFVLNGMVVTGITVDPRFGAGYCGFYVQRGGGAEEAVLGVDWAQLRAILPE
jgi:hypothetical protein